MIGPRVLVVRSPGTNCDGETVTALERAGARPERLHVARLLEGPSWPSRFEGIVFPGGFSYGDDLSAGRVLATAARHHLAEGVARIVSRGGGVLGICNGFQVLAKSGLLPGWDGGGRQAMTLGFNDSRRFEARWVPLLPSGGRSPYLSGLGPFDLPVAHGEGKVILSAPDLERLESERLVALRYVSDRYPDNPNGSMNAIAGVCDPTGRILGLMPHPERFVRATQHPSWTRGSPEGDGAGLALFRNFVRTIGGQTS